MSDGSPGDTSSHAVPTSDSPGDGGDGQRVRRRRLAPFIALAVALVLGALFVVLATSETSPSDEVSSFAVGKPAPQITGTTLDGKAFDLSRRKGSWVVLNFFNTTCLPCRAEHPELVAFYDQQQSLGLAGAELYTMTWGADRDADVRTWFVDNGGDWPVVDDTNGKNAVSLGVAQVPETWIVDPQGVIVARIPSQITADSLSRLVQQFRDQEATEGSNGGSTA
ncbi:MAG: ccmG [Ilumatobacteraceae bacterium]|nr:ccmG [Ilumatobacteraceae bacterium]